MAMSIELVLPIIALGTMSPLFLCFFCGEKVGFLSPVTYLIAIEFVGLFLQSVVIGYLEGGSHYAGYISHGSLLSGMLLALIFNFSYFIGYLAPKHSFSVIRMPRMVSPSSKKNIAFLIFLVGIFLMYRFMAELDVFGAIKSGVLSAKRFVGSGEDEVARGELRMGGDIVLVFGIIKFIRYLKFRRKADFFWFSFSMLSAVTFYFVLSSRTGIVAVLLSFFIISSSFYKGGKVRAIIKLSVYSCLVLVLISAMGVIRKNSGNVDNLEADEGLGLAVFAEHIFSGNYFFTINKAAIVTEKVPEQSPYMIGKTFLPPFYFFIPRVLWDGKPPVRYGPEFAKEMYEIKNDSGIPPSFPVELYWNFGWIGVFVGGFLIGVVTKLIFLKMKKRSREDSAFVYCAYIVFFLVPLMISDFSGAAIGLLLAIAFYLLMNVDDKVYKGEFDEK